MTFIKSGYSDSNGGPPGRRIYEIRTHESSFIISEHQFLSYWLTVTKPGILPTELHPVKPRHYCPGEVPPDCGTPQRNSCPPRICSS